jgi:hypothetical protein
MAAQRMHMRRKKFSFAVVHCFSEKLRHLSGALTTAQIARPRQGLYRTKACTGAKKTPSERFSAGGSEAPENGGVSAESWPEAGAGPGLPVVISVRPRRQSGLTLKRRTHGARRK